MAHKELDTLYAAGLHFGATRTRRHPTAAKFIFTTKDRSDIFDLEETARRLDFARDFLKSLANSGRTILFVGGKHEASAIVHRAADELGMPFVDGRWIGGTLTNFKNIRKRIERLLTLTGERERGELSKYTKKERLLIDREIEELQHRFGGLVKLSDMPAALVVVDTRHEDTAVREANQLKIPVIGIANSDCDFSMIQFPIPANESVVKSISFLMDSLVEAYNAGKKATK